MDEFTSLLRVTAKQLHFNYERREEKDEQQANSQNLDYFS